MADEAVSVETIARPLIEQCRRDIASAWAQIEAAREVLSRGRWLIERWAERSRMAHGTEKVDLSDRSEAARIGMFVTVEPETHGRRGRRDRGGGKHALRKSRPRGHPAMTSVLRNAHPRGA